jgi:hypothetical protein
MKRIYPNEPVEIRGFKFHTPLVLVQAVHGVEMAVDRPAMFILGADFTVSYTTTLSSARRKITAPAGMLTDLISSPFHSIVQPSDPKILGAGIIHDYLYVAHESIEGYRPINRDRKFADDMLLHGMKESGVGWFRRKMVYRAVRIGGWKPFFERDGRSFLTQPELDDILYIKA